MRHRILLFLSVVTVFCTGCSGAPGDVPKTVAVTGIVTMKEKPVSGATVVFIPKSGPSAFGTTDDSGSYVLKTGKLPGAIPGQHTVTITAGGEVPMPGTEAAKKSTVKLEIPKSYGDPNTAGLSAEVKSSGENVFDFKLN
tara:strand:- start:173894 stop:174313 length:420 start_codon:yes stop_codon:yes gene_type:complete